jgi:flagellin-like protein
MRKLWRSRKALSPVIAAIILIAVTVAVSIAVAAWMGALSFTFMATEQVSFTGIGWTEDTVSGNITVCNLEIKNSGTSILTIETVKVNNVETTWATTPADTITLDPNDVVTLDIDPTGTYYARGGNYAFTVITAKNNPFGPYTASAPS